RSALARLRRPGRGVGPGRTWTPRLRATAAPALAERRSRSPPECSSPSRLSLLDHGGTPGAHDGRRFRALRARRNGSRVRSGERPRPIWEGSQSRLGFAPPITARAVTGEGPVSVWEESYVCLFPPEIGR